jgi:1-acyl-sn-glycerol-3-phosphate acyltransferase
MSKIQAPSLFYEFLRVLLTISFPKYFRQIEMVGKENISQNEPLIFAANHQSGLMDPLAVILSQKEPIVYLARADIFSNKISNWFLRQVKVAPIYRIRDGYENLSKNQSQMQLAVEVLLDHGNLGMMPEGNHGEQHKQRPLVKGLFRVAFAAEEALKGEAHVRILPIGIDHSDYQHSGSDLLVQIGKPIHVEDYLFEYQNNPANGLNLLKEKLAAEIGLLINDIRSANYERTYALSCYGVSTYLEHANRSGLAFAFKTRAGQRFEARRALSKVFDQLEIHNEEQLRILDKLCNKLHQLPGTPNEKAEFLDQNPSWVFDLIAFSATIISMPGRLMNVPSRLLFKTMMSGIEDKQMYHSFAFTVGLFSNLIFYPLYACILALWFGTGLPKALALLLLLVVPGIYGQRIHLHLRMYWKMFPFRFGKKQKHLEECRNDYKQFRTKLEALL